MFLASAIEYLQEATPDAVCHLLAGTLTELHPDVAHIPGMQGLFRQRIGQLQTQFCPVAHVEGICQVTGVARLIIVVAVVAEQLTETCALGIQCGHVERVAFPGLRLILRGVYQRLHLRREVHVAQRVDGKQRVECHRVANLHLLWVALTFLFVAHLSVHVPVFPEHRLSHRGA